MNLTQRFKNAFNIILKGQNPVIHTSSSSWDTRGKIQPRDYKAMVNEYYSWVYAAASCNARNVAKAIPHLYIKKGKENGKPRYEEIEELPFLDILKNVNPFMNSFELWSLMQTFLDTTGNAYWYFVPNMLGLPAEIWVVYSQWVKIVPDKEKFIKGYLYQPPWSQKPIAFEENEIVHFKYPNPQNLFYGLGCVEAARYSVDTNTYIKRMEMGIFKNASLPGVVLETDQELSDPVYNRLRKQWDAAHRGVDKAGKTAILEQGLKVSANMLLTPKELDFMGGKKATRQEIGAIFGVPDAKLGSTDAYNRANMEGIEYSYQKETIAPRLTLIQEKINEKVMPLYDNALYFEFENPVPEDKDFALKERESNLKTYYTSVNLERAKEGEAPVPWGEVPFIPFNLMPYSGTTPKPSPAEEPAKAVYNRVYTKREEKKVAAFNASQSKNEVKMKDVFIKFWEEQKRQVLANLKKTKIIAKIAEDDVDYILFSMKTENKRIIDVTKPVLIESLKEGITVGMAEVGIDVDLDLFNEQIARAITKRASLIKGMNETTQKALRGRLLEGIKEGESVAKLSKRVEGYYSEAEKYRSVMAARTETAVASNEGSAFAYQEAGVEKMQWVINPATACDICGPLDGTEAKVEDGFPEGEPGGIHPNCLCTVIPVM